MLVTCKGSGSNCLECTYGYYQLGLTCVRCPINCKNCKSNGIGGQICTECSEFAIGRSQQLEDQCQCLNGYFERETVDCGICVTPCVTCVNTRINCLTCVEDGENREPAPDCNCLANFYAFETTCKRCSYNCKTCQFQATFCLSCYGTGLHRTTNLPDCECEEGWFDNGEDDCKQCKYPCVTCVNTKNNCLTCIFELEDRYPAPNCECLDGQYQETDYHCLPCLWKCTTCVTQLDQCLTCSDENRKEPTCNCNQGWFGLDPDPLCYKCHKYCQTCELAPENCLICLDDPNREDIPNCACIPGYYHDDEDSICKQCIYPCLECSNINTCISCSQVLDPARKDIDLNCKCFSGFYSNKIDKCELCPKKCATCHLVDEQVQCINENPLLEECEIQCLSCLQSQENCLICSPGFQRSLKPPICGCNEGFYIDTLNLTNNDCLICPSQCKTCALDALNNVMCIKCLDESFMLPYCTSQQQSFSVIRGNQIIITQCAIQCETCDGSAENCLVCSSGLNRSQVTPDCLCKEGFYDNEFGQFNCLPCKKECLSCTRYNICTACVKGLNRELNVSTGLCECNKGYRPFNKGDLKCVLCYTYGKKCYIQCPQNTRLNQVEGICEDYELQLPSSQIILFTVFILYAFFKIVMCTGIIGKFKLRLQGLKIIEPRIPLEELEQNSNNSQQQSQSENPKTSRIFRYFQQGFTQGDPDLNLSSSSSSLSSDNIKDGEPKIKQSQVLSKNIYQKSYRGQIPLNDMQNCQGSKQNRKNRKHKPKLNILLSSLISKAKQLETSKLSIVSNLNINKDQIKNQEKSMGSTLSKFNLDDSKSIISQKSNQNLKIQNLKEQEKEEKENKLEEQQSLNILDNTFGNSVKNQDPFESELGINVISSQEDNKQESNFQSQYDTNKNMQTLTQEQEDNLKIILKK